MISRVSSRAAPIYCVQHKKFFVAATLPNLPCRGMHMDAVPNRTALHTDSVSFSASSHGSVRKTVEQLKDKGEVPMFDVQVGDIIASKPDQRVVVISPTSTVFEAVKLMSESKVGALIVAHNKKPVGVISERDYLNKVVIHGLSSKTTHVQDIMTKDIVTTPTNISAAKCMDIMTKGRFRHIPVVDDRGQILGIVSIGDLVKHVLDQQKVTIQHLKDYIERTY